MTQTSLLFPPDSGVSCRWMDPQANGSDAMRSTPVASQLATVMIAPELSATVLS